MKINAFCCACQSDKPHDVIPDGNGELVLKCDCKHYIKAPALPADRLAAFLVDHRAQNVGRVFLNQAVEDQKASDLQAYLNSISKL